MDNYNQNNNIEYSFVNPEKSKKEKVISKLVNIYLIATVVIAFICTYSAYTTKMGGGVPNVFGYEILSVQSNSMVPVFEKGDLVISKEVKDSSSLRVGDIISFWTIVNGERIINTHRIESIGDAPTYKYFVTKGDANSQTDPMSVPETDIVGMYRTRIKSLGNVFDFLQTSKGFFIVVVIPVIIFFLYYLINFISAYIDYKKIRQKVSFEKRLGIYDPSKDKDLEKDDKKVKKLTPEQIEMLMQKAKEQPQQGQQTMQGQFNQQGQPLQQAQNGQQSNYYNPQVAPQQYPNQQYCGQPMYGNPYYGQMMPMQGQPMPMPMQGQPAYMPGQFYGPQMIPGQYYGPQMVPGQFYGPQMIPGQYYGPQMVPGQFYGPQPLPNQCYGQNMQTPPYNNGEDINKQEQHIQKNDNNKGSIKTDNK